MTLNVADKLVIYTGIFIHHHQTVSSIQKGNSDALQPRYAEEHEAEDHIEATVHTRSPELDNRSDESC